jgi:predicted flavoprotein YhiN
MDIDGITGGFNFQSAWTTGFIAGKNVGNNPDTKTDK